jgi:threonine dehydratase
MTRAMDMPTPALTLADIEETRKMIAPHVVRTPVHDWRGREIEALIPPGTVVNLKLELFQRSGTFKARGAVSKALRLSPEELARGITAVSAGNHAIAAAYAAATTRRCETETRASNTLNGPTIGSGAGKP